MKTCPENDKVLLFCERELSEVEQAEFELHLKSCAECRKEVEQISADDALLKEGVEEAFARHRVSNRIMQQIRSEKTVTVPVSNQSLSGWRYFWLTALALLAVLIAASLYTPAAMKYHGRAQGVMIQALNDSSILQGERLAVDQAVKLETLQPVALDGCFLFTVTNGHTSVFKMSGKATARLAAGQPEFFDSEAIFELVSGARLTITVNQQPLLLERKILSTLAPSGNINQQPASGSASDIGQPLIGTATTTDGLNAIVESGGEETVLIGLPAENATATSTASGETPASESWVDPTLAPMKNPFADEPIELNGN